jgi:hypothetical protein
MSVCFEPGSTLGRKDLNIFLTNSSGNPSNAYSITFALFWVDPVTEVEVLIGDPSRTPVNPSVGEYYAAIMVPPNASPGGYRIRWTFQELASTPVQTVVQEFGVVIPGSVGSNVGGTGLNAAQAECVRKLRVLLRDNNPDRNYHFRPPEHEGTIGCYNQVFGYIWTDEELVCYLEIALDWWNSMPPETEDLCTLGLLVQRKPAWKTAILWGAMVHALMALSINWVADEFDYSIGGISLSIDKSSKYESLKQNAEGQFDKATEAKRAATKFMRGLSQPRFGIGVRSAFGPHVGRGILSPRRFL